MYKTILEAIAGQPGSDTTQISTTTGSYTKAALYLRDTLNLPETAKVLDYGAGLGMGTQAIQRVFQNTESYEPLPGRATQAPTYTRNTQIPQRAYDAVICLNVLNVLEKPTRDQVMLDILRAVKPGGGVAIIGTRGWSGDVAANKFVEMDPEDDHAGWLERKTATGVTRVYQKGFTSQELARYAQSIWGGKAASVKMIANLTKAAIVITKA
jgi:SAM-dependent methyltransferase